MKQTSSGFVLPITIIYLALIAILVSITFAQHLQYLERLNSLKFAVDYSQKLKNELMLSYKNLPAQNPQIFCLTKSATSTLLAKKVLCTIQKDNLPVILGIWDEESLS